MQREFSRHEQIFDARHIAEDQISVVGCGSVGGHIALLLSKLGVKSLHLWDDDVVQRVNVGNQIFGRNDVRKNKTEALRQILSRNTRLVPEVHEQKVELEEQLGSFVFLAVDSMSARHQIWKMCLLMNPQIAMVFDTRMSDDMGIIYSVIPSSGVHITLWEEAWYPDEDSEEAACTTKVSVGPTAMIVAGYAVWQFMRFVAAREGEGPLPEFECRVGMCPPEIVLR
jgi:molybdopterin/thiamine biosynthesis adenylyltransferase